jgi:hypothetical protein
MPVQPSSSKEKKKKFKVAPKNSKQLFQDEITKEHTNSFDYGGLPTHDLKRNLGCG